MPNTLASYGFPDNYATVVSGSTNVKYVSATGSNANDGNSPTSPYLTIAQAQTATSGISTSVTIVIMAGTYTVTPGVATGTADAVAGLSDNNLPRKFVCCPGQTVIQWSATGAQRDATMVDFRNSGSVLYGATLLRDNNARTNTYSAAFFNSSTAGTQQGTFYNCVFRETNANNVWSFQYDNAGTQTQKIYNCTLYAGAGAQTNWTSSSSVILTNTVINTTTTTGATETNVLQSQTVNSTTYVTTGVTTAGVYSGTYAWNGTITQPLGLTAPATATSGTAFTVTLTTSGVANGTLVPYTISGVTSTQLNNASLTGNFTMSNNTANFSVSTSKYLFITPATMTVSASSYSSNTVISYPVMSTSVARPPLATSLTTSTPNTIKTSVMDRVANAAISGAQLDLTNNQKTVLNSSRTSTTTGSTVMATVVSADSNTVQKTVSTSMMNSQSGGILGPRSNTITTTSGGMMNTYVVQPGGGKQPREYWM